MKVGIDLDGLVVDNYPYWRELFVEWENIHGHPIKNKDLAVWGAPSWDYLENICKLCWHKCLHSARFILGYQPKPEAVATLDWLDFLGIELHQITSRPKDVTDMTFEWLDKYNLTRLYKTITITDDKVSLAKELDLNYMIDDAPHNIESFKSSPTKCIIWDMPYNSHLKGTRATTWYQVANILVAAHQKEKNAIVNT